MSKGKKMKSKLHNKKFQQAGVIELISNVT